MAYALIRSALFALEPETAHDWVLRGVDLMGAVIRDPQPAPGRRIKLLGMEFPNRIGLAADLAVRVVQQPRGQRHVGV